MPILLYCCILLTTVTQSASTKLYQRTAHDPLIFNACKACAACLLFGLLCIGSFTFHLPTVLYGLIFCQEPFSLLKGLGLLALTLAMVTANLGKGHLAQQPIIARWRFPVWRTPLFSSPPSPPGRSCFRCFAARWYLVNG